MFKFGNAFANAQTMRDGLITSNTSIKALVVDYKRDLLAYVAEVLHSCSFEVTCVDHCGAALRLLSEKNRQFDLLLIDSDMSDVDTHTFLRLTKSMDVLSVVMSEQDNDAFIHEVFKSGAFLVVKRPLTIEAVRHIRQDIIRKRMHAHEKCKSNNINVQNETQDVQENKGSGSKKGKCVPKKRVQRSSSDDDDDDVDYDCEDYNVDINMKKKICVEWTEELHEKFVQAVNQLGEGRCFPKKILDLMGVPGLTRMQVASHLQKCRKEKLNFRKKNPSPNHVMPSNLFPNGLNERKFGCMPSLQIDQKDHEKNNTLIGINLSINGWQTEAKHMKNQTYTGSSMLNISNHKNIEQRVEYTQIPFENDVELNHNGGFGSKTTKATSSCFQQTMCGAHDDGQGSTDQHLASIQRQAPEEFPDFLKDLDGNGPNDM
ncbi:hypothetical protein QVD17_41963 [Tagetes erecta]|uniref:Two-component response regulator n=1 Tax=Tagetes erecta TaxID=13708 RepID=A0AAD8NE04_TARER|nr:hypothetical protein QVD17_41963 [Tagetes erecta]